jgi:hypothetical protein
LCLLLSTETPALGLVEGKPLLRRRRSALMMKAKEENIG